MMLPFDVQRCTGYQPNDPFERIWCVHRITCRRFLERDKRGPWTPIAHATTFCRIKIEDIPN